MIIPPGKPQVPGAEKATESVAVDAGGHESHEFRGFTGVPWINGACAARLAAAESALLLEGGQHPLGGYGAGLALTLPTAASLKFPEVGSASPSRFLRPSSPLPSEAADRCMEDGGRWPLIWNNIPPAPAGVRKGGHFLAGQSAFGDAKATGVGEGEQRC